MKYNLKIESPMFGNTFADQIYAHKILRLASSLAFYADQENWNMKNLPDGGHEARVTLSDLGIKFNREEE